MSTYNFEVADTAMHARHFDDFEAEAARCLEARLPLPAYDYVLKCSHAFNLLDSRRAIAVTDRAAYILRMRRLAQAVAAHVPGGRARPVPDLLVEIGCEELPAAACREAEAQLPGLLAERRSTRPGSAADAVRVHVAPRRLAAIAHRAARPSGRRSAPRCAGPRADAPEQARAGFARKHGLAAGDLDRARRVRVGGRRRARRRRCAELVPGSVRAARRRAAVLASRCAGTTAASRVRCGGWWSSSTTEAVPVELFGLAASGESRGHRFLGGPVEVGRRHQLPERPARRSV